MVEPVAEDLRYEDPRIAEAILQYLEAKESDTPFNVETWLSSHPEDIRPALKSFLVNQAVVARATETVSPATSNVDIQPFGCYRDFVFLAEGGMGTIYRCKDTRLQRPLAIKVLHRRLMAQGDLPLRFKEEAQVASQLLHPNIAPVHEMGELADGRPYFTMKLVEGRTFSESIREYHANPTDERFERLLRDFVSICNGVEFAHSRNVLHRDLKPANVMVGRFGEVLVMDWGLTKLLGPSAPEKHSTDWSIRTDRGADPDGRSQPGIRGTPAYMPPEQANASDKLDARCDVFALGVILCQILTGRPAYSSDNPDPRARTKELIDRASRGHTAEAFARLDARREPRELIELAKRCMSFAPSDRPATAKDVGDAVTHYQAGVQRRAHDAEVGRARAEAAAHAERRRRRWQLGLVAAILLLVTGAVSGGMWYRFDREAKRAQEEVRANEEKRLHNERIAFVRSGVDEMYDGLKGDQVAKAAAALARAKGRLGPEAPADLASIVAEAEENYSDHLALERIRIEKGILSFDDTPIFDDTARSYARFFSQRGFDLTDPNLPSRLAASPIRNSLIAAFDDWATHETDPAKQDHLFVILREADPDAVWANRLRDRSIRKDRERLKAIIAEVPWDKMTSSFLFALLTAFEKDPEIAGPLLQSAAVRFANDFWFNMATGVILAMQAADNPKERQSLRKKALGYFRTGVALRPDNDAALAVFALFTIQDGDYQEAKLIIERLESRPVDSWTKYMALGRLTQKQGRHRAAADHYKKACELSEHISSQVEYAQASLLVGDLSEAAKAVDRILEKNPNHPNVLPLKAVILAMQKKTALAMIITRKVLEANPRSMGGRVALFTCFLQQGRMLDADRVMASFTPEEQKNESLGELEYLFEIFRGNLERAVTLMKRFPADSPTYLVDCYQIVSLANLGRFTEAKQLADKTVKAINDNRIDLAALTGGEVTVYSLGSISLFLGRIVKDEANLESGPGPDLPAIVAKKTAPLQVVASADLFLAKRRFHDALTAYEHALPAGASIGGTRQFMTLMPGTCRFKALRAAAQTLAGSGPKAKSLDETERNHVRELALRWFQEEVAALRQLVAATNATDPATLLKAKQANFDLHFLKMHRDLEPLRDPARIGEMPEKDRKLVEELWAEVDKLLVKLNPPLEWLKLPTS